MAEKTTTTKKRPARQQMLEALTESEKTVSERREAQAKPEEKLEARATSHAVAVAEELSRGVVQTIGELKAGVGKLLGELSDQLETQMSRYVQIQRAIAAKDQELKEIYEIQRSATTLTALLETHERKREELETEIASSRQELEREIEQTRAQWEEQAKQRDIEAKERDTAEQKRREREKEEYRYAFAREQQQAKDQFADEMNKARKELAERKAESEKELAERERAIKSREEELAALRQRADSFPKEMEAAIAKATKDAISRIQQESAGKEEILKREFAGERNVLTTRITSLEQTVKEQSDQIAKLLQQAEKAYGQVQEIAVRAIEGSGSAKQLASLQQMLADQSRKGGER